jgi:hypothetical protein
MFHVKRLLHVPKIILPRMVFRGEFVDSFYYEGRKEIEVSGPAIEILATSSDFALCNLSQAGSGIANKDFLPRTTIKIRHEEGFCVTLLSLTRTAS